MFFQNFCQYLVAFFKAGNGIHNLMVRRMASGLIQLHSQVSQFLGMGSIVTNHILHQRNQFFHRGVGMVMGMAVLVQMIVTVRMLMRV